MAQWTLEHELDFSGGKVRYGVLGEGPPVVLVHGTPFSSYVWRRIASALAPYRTVYVFDLLGYGQSEKRQGQDVSLGIQNEVLTALLRHWDLERPTVVAHDFGGTTALRAHLLNGRDFHRLLLMDAVAIRPWGSPLVQHARDHLDAFTGLPAYLHRALLAAYIRTTTHRPMSDAELEPYIAPWLGDVGQPAFYRQIAQMDERYTDEIEPHLSSIRCPVRVLWGEQDQMLPLSQGERLSSMIPGSTFRPIPDVGHLVQEEAPELIVAEVLSLG